MHIQSTIIYNKNIKRKLNWKSIENKQENKFQFNCIFQYNINCFKLRIMLGCPSDVVTVWETTARQLAKCECEMTLASWHVCLKYDNLLLDS